MDTDYALRTVRALRTAAHAKTITKNPISVFAFGARPPLSFTCDIIIIGLGLLNAAECSRSMYVDCSA